MRKILLTIGILLVGLITFAQPTGVGGRWDLPNAFHRIGTDTIATRAYARSVGGDLVLPSGTAASTQDINDSIRVYLADGETGVALADSSAVAAPNSYVTGKMFEDGIASINGYSASKIQFITDTTAGAPSAGDSIYSHNMFVDKHIEVYRGGNKLYRKDVGQLYRNGYSFQKATGKVVFTPHFETNEEIIVEVTDSVSWTNLSLGQNLLLYSEAIEGPYPTWQGNNVTVSEGVVPDVNGVATMDTLIQSSAYGTWRQELTVTASTDYIFAFDAKRGTMTTNHYAIYDVTHSTYITKPTNYYTLINSSTPTRVSFPFTTPSGCTSIRVFLSSNSDATGTVFLGRVQVAAPGSNYVKTTDTVIQ